MAFDFKKEYRELYQPSNKPSIIRSPKANYLAVKGKGNPNEENSEYKKAIQLLYGIAYTIKMSYKTSHHIEGFFEYVVPPLEGFWWYENSTKSDCIKKDEMAFIAIIRVPDFVTLKVFQWAQEEASKKKKMDFSKVTFLEYDEGLCVQCMHIGAYDDEPITIQLMSDYAKQQGYMIDITNQRYHHEIYLSNPNKTETSKLKTIIRHPIKKISDSSNV